MNRFANIVVCGICLVSIPAWAGDPGKIYKIGISVLTGYPENVRGFKQTLQQAGLVEGKNIEYLYRKSGMNKDKLEAAAMAFKAAEVDLVYSLTTPGTIVIKKILPETTPIVFSIVTYPADSGLIDSFDYSANNLVGTSNFVPLKYYVNLIQLLIPDAKRLAIFHRKGEPNSKIQASNMIRLLRKTGIEIIDREPESVAEVKKMGLALADRVDGFITTTDTLMQGGGEEKLIAISLDRRIPIVSSNKNGILAGSTFGPVADFYTLGKMAGEMAAKILIQQIDPAALTSKLQDPPLILVNRNSIRKIGLALPDGLPKFSFVD